MNGLCGKEKEEAPPVFFLRHDILCSVQHAVPESGNMLSWGGGGRPAVRGELGGGTRDPPPPPLFHPFPPSPIN